MRLYPFNEVILDVTSKFNKLKSSEYSDVGIYKIIDQGLNTIAGYTEDSNLVNFDYIPVIIFGDHTRKIKYFDEAIALGADGVKALHVKNELFDAKYIYYFLKSLKIESRGYSRHFKYLKKFSIPIPFRNGEIDLPCQKRIAYLLSKVESLIDERKQSLEQLDELLKSVFLDMFGDPIRNEKGWNQPPLKMFGQISTGNTPSRKDSDNYSEDYIEWIKTDNIPSDSVYVSNAAEHLSEKGAKKGRLVSRGALLVACIAGSIESIGRAALTNRKVAFNQQINAIQPNTEVNSFYLYVLFLVAKSYIQSYATKGMKKIITKGEFEKISLIKPPLELQNKFSTVAEKILNIKDQYQSNLSDLETLYNALSQKAFKGELDLSGIKLEEGEVEPSSFEKLQKSIEAVNRLIPEPVKRVTETVNKIIPPSVQRLSKQIEALPQIPESTLRTLKFLSERPEMQIHPFSHLDLFGFNDPKARQKILEHWFNEWLEESQVDELKLHRFWGRARRSLVDYLYEEDLEEYQFTVEDYDVVKKLLFQAIDNGLIEQGTNIRIIKRKDEIAKEVMYTSLGTLGQDK